MNSTVLSTEVATDPLGLGYASFVKSSPQTVCDILNAPTQTAGSIARAGFVNWCAAPGMQAAIQNIAVSSANPVWQTAASAIIAFLNSTADPLVLTNAMNSVMLNAWVAAGALTKANQEALIALAAIKVSRASVLGLPSVQVSDLAVVSVGT